MLDHVLMLESGGTPTTFAAVYYDWESLSWAEGERMVATLDPETERITFEVGHFSTVVMFDPYGPGDFVAQWMVVTEQVADGEPPAPANATASRWRARDRRSRSKRR